MKLFSCQQVREFDRQTVGWHKIPSLILMEHAGVEVARTARELLGVVGRKRLLVICGPGNNGGDGLAASRILHDWGAQVQVYLLADEKMMKGDAKANYNILRSLKSDLFVTHQAFQDALRNADCVIDAIFGIGLKRPVEVEVAAIIQAVNESRKPVIAVDLPSGIDGDTGKILGHAVKAVITVALAAAKTGLLLYPARAYVGKLKIAYLALPREILEQAEPQARMAEPRDIACWLPAWKSDIHKGERGQVMVLGGSRGLSGAPALASMAALHSGSGLVYLGIPDGIRTLMEHKLTEVIKVGIPQSNNWVFGKPSLPETRSWFEKIDALAIGPGAGRAEETQDYVKTVIQEYPGPLVVDADGLFALDGNFLKAHGRRTMILTPHEGEMGRLCGLDPAKVHGNRFELAVEKAKEWNVTLVLKGASTLIVSGNSIWINPTGNAGMATAGAGDVLTGIIVSLLGQGLDPEKAAVTGTYLHGLSGDLLKKELGVHGITAERLSTFLCKAFRSLER